MLFLSFLLKIFLLGSGVVFAAPTSLGNGVTWELVGNTLTIGYSGTGSGVMPTYASNTSSPWSGSRTSITTVNIEEGITVIGGYAFNGFSAVSTISPSLND